jgi:hypothetical protein
VTAQVIFLNLGYFPDNDEYDRLDEIQDNLHFGNVTFLHELKDKPPWEVAIRKDELHKSVRQRIHIVDTPF